MVVCARSSPATMSFALMMAVKCPARSMEMPRRIPVARVLLVVSQVPVMVSRVRREIPSRSACSTRSMSAASLFWNWLRMRARRTESCLSCSVCVSSAYLFLTLVFGYLWTSSRSGFHVCLFYTLFPSLFRLHCHLIPYCFRLKFGDDDSFHLAKQASPADHDAVHRKHCIRN